MQERIIIEVDPQIMTIDGAKPKEAFGSSSVVLAHEHLNQNLSKRIQMQVLQRQRLTLSITS